jgi:uncharacterized protein YuzE
MELTYDPRHNIAYLRFRDPDGMLVDTIRVSDEINVDLAPDGAVCGIELLNANTQLGMSGGHLVLDLLGQRFDVPLPEVA